MKYKVLYSDDPKSETVLEAQTPSEAARVFTLSRPRAGSHKITVYTSRVWGGNVVYHFRDGKPFPEGKPTSPESQILGKSIPPLHRKSDASEAVNIFIRRYGKEMGPYSESQMRSFLETTAVNPDDLARTDGMADWKLLRDILPAEGQQSSKAVTPPAAERIKRIRKLLHAFRDFLDRRITARAVLAATAVLLVASWTYPPWVHYGRYSRDTVKVAHGWFFIFDTEQNERGKSSVVMRIDSGRLLLSDAIVAALGGMLAWAVSGNSPSRSMAVRLVFYSLLAVPLVGLVYVGAFVVHRGNVWLHDYWADQARLEHWATERAAEIARRLNWEENHRAEAQKAREEKAASDKAREDAAFEISKRAAESRVTSEGKPKALTPPAPKKMPHFTNPTPQLTGAIARQFTTEMESQLEAVRHYPELGIEGSKFNKEFIARTKLYRKSRPAYFSDPSWPLRLAEEIAPTLLPTR